MKRLLLVDVDSARSAAVRAHPPEEMEVVAASAASALEHLRDDIGIVAAAVLGPSMANPVQLAQRSHSIDPKTAVLILSEPGRVAAMQQALMFAPYINDLTICRAPTSDDELVAEVNGLCDLAERRRNFGLVLRDAQARIAREPKAAVHPSYLGALLDLVPIGIVALDPSGDVTAMNPFATRLFGVHEKDALGRPFVRLLREQDAPVVERLLGAVDAASESVHGIACDQTRIVELTMSRAEHRRGRSGFLVVAQDVTEKTSLLKRLERAIHTRDEFLSAASHELKTPIAALRLNAQHAARLGNQSGHARLGVVAKRIDVATARIAEQIDYLLDVTRLGNRAFSLDRAKCDLAEIAREVFSALFDSARAAGCELTLRVPERVVGDWDGPRLEQVLTNLVINAIKFGRGHAIELAIAEADGLATLTVRDFGIGIAPADQQRIFDQFERGVDTHTHGGWGLGLWISTRIIEAHGGSLSVESTLGEGSIFTAVLPKSEQ